MGKRQNKHRKFIFSAVFVLLGIPVLTVVINNLNANGISWVCQQSEECVKAAQEEEAANQKNAESLSAASEYEVKVKELSNQISAQEAVIADTKSKIKDLKVKIKETEAKLKEKQEGLAELLVNMHFEGDAEPIKILAGSNSISDLAEKASRTEVAKREIAAAAEAVQDTKEKLEKQKVEVEDLLDEQKNAQEELVSVRSEQQEFVRKYKDDADAYAEVARAAREAQQKAMEEFQAAHPEMFGGMGAYYGAFNSYPWQDQCPQNQDAVAYEPRRYYLCECTDYAAWKVYETYHVNWVAWGNAGDWYGTALANGANISVGVPVAHSVGQAGGGPYGHVFWVESVNGDGSINVTEYNNAYATQLYTGSFHYGDFGSRTISAGEAATYNYLWP